MRWFGVAFALLFFSAPARAEIVVTISKAEQRMSVAIDGAPTYRWTVSTGRPGFATPSGGFHAIRLERVYYSKKYDDAPMPNSVFFYGGYAMHGTMEEGRLGRPVSHGCVRLARANAATLYALVQRHGMSRTRIVITDGPLPGARGTPMARLRDSGFGEMWRREWRDERPRAVVRDRPDIRYQREGRDDRRWREAPGYQEAPRFQAPQTVYEVPRERAYQGRGLFQRDRVREVEARPLTRRDDGEGVVVHRPGGNGLDW